MDESYFGSKHILAKRGRKAGHKTIAFGLFKRNIWVYTKIIPDTKKRTLQGLVRGEMNLYSIIHFNGYPYYHGLVDAGYAKHYRVKHGKNKFTNDQFYINGTESFCAYARLSTLKSIQKDMSAYI